MMKNWRWERTGSEASCGYCVCYCPGMGKPGKQYHWNLCVGSYAVLIGHFVVHGEVDTQ